MSQQSIVIKDTLSDSIRQRHFEAERLQDSAMANISALIEKRIEAASLVESARAQLGRAAFREWWKESGLPLEWDSRYLRLAKTAARARLMDRNQLRLVGILPEAESDGKELRQRDQGFSAWAKNVGKIQRMIQPEKVKAWTRDERAIAASILKPLAEAYARIAREGP